MENQEALASYLKEVRELKAMINDVRTKTLELDNYAKVTIKQIQTQLLDLQALNPEAAKGIVSRLMDRIQEVELQRNPITFEGRFNQVEDFVSELRPKLQKIENDYKKANEFFVSFDITPTDEYVKIIKRKEFTNEEIQEAYIASGLQLKHIMEEFHCAMPHASRLKDGEVQDIETRAKLMAFLTKNRL